MAIIKYPEIKVELINRDGNAFAILARIRGAMRDAGLKKEEIQRFITEATSGTYEDLLSTCKSWITIT